MKKPMDVFELIRLCNEFLVLTYAPRISTIHRRLRQFDETCHTFDLTFEIIFRKREGFNDEGTIVWLSDDDEQEVEETDENKPAEAETK